MWLAWDNCTGGPAPAATYSEPVTADVEPQLEPQLMLYQLMLMWLCLPPAVNILQPVAAEVARMDASPPRQSTSALPSTPQSSHRRDHPVALPTHSVSLSLSLSLSLSCIGIRYFHISDLSWLRSPHHLQYFMCHRIAPHFKGQNFRGLAMWNVWKQIRRQGFLIATPIHSG